MKKSIDLNYNAKLLLNSINMINDDFLKRRIQEHNKKVMQYIEYGREIRFKCGIIFIEDNIYQKETVPKNKYINQGNGNIYCSGKYKSHPHTNHYSAWSKWEK